MPPIKYRMLTKHTIVKHDSDPNSNKMENFIGSKRMKEDGRG